MLYYLFAYLHKEFDMPGAGVFQYISFRAALAIITSLIIAMVFGKRIIGYLLRMQVGETVRDLGLDGQKEKQGTPTMGGLIMLGAILIPTLLFARLMNVYVIIMIVTTVWLGIIGFIDDYIKVFKKDKDSGYRKEVWEASKRVGANVEADLLKKKQVRMKYDCIRNQAM